MEKLLKDLEKILATDISLSIVYFEDGTATYGIVDETNEVLVLYDETLDGLKRKMEQRVKIIF